jgi:hypothetical protein
MEKNMNRFAMPAGAVAALLVGLLGVALALPHSAARADAEDRERRILPVQPLVVSTVPPNGDLNPYGVAFVPPEFPARHVLQPGDILVSNFNDVRNLQGTGTTIIRVTPDGHTSVFFQGRPPLGLTTGLFVLKSGFVIVGNFPSTNGLVDHAKHGSLLVLDGEGELLAPPLTHPTLQGPWDLTVDEDGDVIHVFVSNALTGTVNRYDLDIDGRTVSLLGEAQVAAGYVHRDNATTFVVSPTGLAHDDRRDILYVSSTGDNTVYAIDGADSVRNGTGKGRVIFHDDAHLHGALALALGPLGHLFVTNSDGINVDPNQPSELVELTVGGKFIAQYSLDPGLGGAFGVGFGRQEDDFIRFAAVNDNQNTLEIFNVPVPERDCDR